MARTQHWTLGKALRALPKTQNLLQRSGSGWIETLLNNDTNTSSNGEIFSIKGIDESQPPSSLGGQVTNNVETDTGVSTNQNHKDSGAYVETVEEESLYDHDSIESHKPSLKHNTQERSVESEACVYLWGPQDWLTHPSLYCKYMDRYLYMPLEVDSATSLPSLGPS